MASSDKRKEMEKNLLEAASSGNLRVLEEVAKELNQGELREIKDAKGLTAFHLGASHGRKEICQFFVEDLGFPVDFFSEKGETPLLYAAMGGHAAEVTIYLISHGAVPVVSNNAGFTPLHFSAIHGLSLCNLDFILFWTSLKHH